MLLDNLISGTFGYLLCNTVPFPLGMLGRILLHLDRLVLLWRDPALLGVEMRLHLPDVFESLEAILLYEPLLIHVEELPMPMMILTLDCNLDSLLWYQVGIT